MTTRMTMTAEEESRWLAEYACTCPDWWTDSLLYKAGQHYDDCPQCDKNRDTQPAETPRSESARRDKRATQPRCLDGCGTFVQTEGNRCPKCAGKKISKERLGKNKRRAGDKQHQAVMPKGPQLPTEPCTCAQHSDERGSWHEASCAWHAHRWMLPPASDGNGSWMGVCVCGASKNHRPFAAEEERHAERVSQTAEAARVKHGSKA